jgi:hypothetical protein
MTDKALSILEQALSSLEMVYNFPELENRDDIMRRTMRRIGSAIKELEDAPCAICGRVEREHSPVDSCCQGYTVVLAPKEDEG